VSGVPPEALVDALVVCTLDRPGELEACLESVLRQTAPPATTLVVDASGDDRSRKVVASMERAWPPGCAIEHRASPAGLPRQRRLGVEATSGDLVHFVDDDSILEPGYLAAVRAAFASDAGIGGVGGFVTNQPPHRVRAVDVWLQLDSPVEGAVLRSGRNVRVYTRPDGLLDVDWLPGCAMSFRRAVLAEEPPRDDVPFDGEDVELSYRVRQHRRLVVAPDARVTHLEARAGRRSAADLVAPEIAARHRRVRAGTGAVSRRAFWISVWGQLGWYGAKGILSRSRERLAIARATARGIRSALTYDRRHR
jgi:GT2 family glycosyltransferase